MQPLRFKWLSYSKQYLYKSFRLVGIAEKAVNVKTIDDERGDGIYKQWQTRTFR
jgi:hypothetical protein